MKKILSYSKFNEATRKKGFSNSPTDIERGMNKLNSKLNDAKKKLDEEEKKEEEKKSE